jgi:hypothetical protein
LHAVHRTTQQAVERLAGRMLAYGGTVHCRGNRLRLVLHESITHSGGSIACLIGNDAQGTLRR